MVENLGEDTGRHGPEGRVADLLRILEVSRRLAIVSDLPGLLQTIEESAARVLDCEHVGVFLPNPEDDDLCREGTGPNEMRAYAGNGIVGEAFRRGLVVSDPTGAPGDPPARPREGEPAGGLLACPLIGWENAMVGVLLAADKRGGRFDAWDEVLAKALGAQAGVAIQRVQLDPLNSHRASMYDLDIARQIQQALLPRRVPAIAGYDVAGWSQPADTSGGDFFDFQERPGGRLAIAVADVSGHGLGPALVVAECRALIRATLAQTEEPDRVLAQVNNLLCGDLLQERFVTAFLGLLDAQANRISYVSAGHGPLLFHSYAGGETRELEAQGCPLGLPDAGNYSPALDIAFEIGDHLVIVTDGFFEWTDPRGQSFGVDRLRDRLHRSRDRPAAAIIRDLHQAVLAFCGGTPQPDDLTAVVIKRLD